MPKSRVCAGAETLGLNGSAICRRVPLPEAKRPEKKPGVDKPGINKPGVNKPGVKKTSDDLVACAIDRLDQWLSAEPVLGRDGQVAGVVRDGRCAYSYPEIAGYYLSYLTQLPSFPAEKAGRVRGWLSRWWRDKPPQTRVYSSPQPDWRNRFLFSFDLAMICRGLLAIQRFGLDSGPLPAIAQFLRTRFFSDGFHPFVAVGAEHEAPTRWSTCPGAYQLKSLAALGPIEDSCLSRQASASAVPLVNAFSAGQSWADLPAHPRLYALEGLIQVDTRTRTAARVTKVLEQMVETQHPDQQRNDVQAQILRLFCVLAADHPVAHRLAHELALSVQATGLMPFKSDFCPLDQAEGNVWCAIFARQALDFFQRSDSGNRPRAAELI